MMDVADYSTGICKVYRRCWGRDRCGFQRRVGDWLSCLSTRL